MFSTPHCFELSATSNLSFTTSVQTLTGDSWMNMRLFLSTAQQGFLYDVSALAETPVGTLTSPDSSSASSAVTTSFRKRLICSYTFKSDLLSATCAIGSSLLWALTETGKFQT
jgi:hypothetical protein